MAPTEHTSHSYRTLASHPKRKHPSDTCAAEDPALYIHKTNGQDFFPVPSSLPVSLTSLSLAPAEGTLRDEAQRSDST